MQIHSSRPLLYWTRSVLKKCPPATVLATVAFLGCRNGDPVDQPAPEPVTECKQYETALSACFHRSVSIASEAAYLPKSEADRPRVQLLCSQNLERIESACPTSH
jgi:hypothetical protein